MEADPPVSLVYAIPDHPWVDSTDGAAVRIAMTVGRLAEDEGVLQEVTSETFREDETVAEVTLSPRQGRILADLTIGPDVAGVLPLRANDGLSCPGFKLHGAGFIVTPEQSRDLGLGRLPGLEQHIRLYRNGRDLTGRPRNAMVIDLFGMTQSEVREKFPEVFQWVRDRVKPERDQNNRATYRDNWWIFGEPRGKFRPALRGLTRYIATVETAKHRFFTFFDGTILPDNMIIAIALDDSYYLGVLSSRLHVVWSLATGGTLEDRPRYNKTRCFEPFPFAEVTDAQAANIREIAERLDSHRKRQIELHPRLTMTGMYNVLDKLRRNEELTVPEKSVYDQGLIAVLRELHDELDSSVLSAYGLPSDASDEVILTELVELNRSTLDAERRGIVRWLRPEFQSARIPVQEADPADGDVPSETEVPAPETRIGKKQKWPKAIPDQVRSLRGTIAAQNRPVTATELVAQYTRASVDSVQELLETLVALGHLRRIDQDTYLPVRARR